MYMLKIACKVTNKFIHSDTASLSFLIKKQKTLSFSAFMFYKFVTFATSS